jgi:hypothetical protein
MQVTMIPGPCKLRIFSDRYQIILRARLLKKTIQTAATCISKVASRGSIWRTKVKTSLCYQESCFQIRLTSFWQDHYQSLLKSRFGFRTSSKLKSVRLIHRSCWKPRGLGHSRCTLALTAWNLILTPWDSKFTQLFLNHQGFWSKTLNLWIIRSVAKTWSLELLCAISLEIRWLQHLLWSRAGLKAVRINCLNSKLRRLWK